MRDDRPPIPMPNDSSPLDVIHDNHELFPADANIEEFEEGSGAGAVVVHHAITAILVVMCLGLATWAYLTFKKASFFEPSTENQRTIEPFVVQAQVDRIRVAIDVYYKLFDKYPNALEELVVAGILDATDPLYPPSPTSSIVYRKTGPSYELLIQTVTTTVKE